MAQIQPITTWFQGSEHQANVFSLYGTANNLIAEGSATFTYQLIELVGITPEQQTSQILVTGVLTINGFDYESWNASTDPNGFIYNWAADRLNLIIVTL